jgi:hypothetical protein
MFREGAFQYKAKNLGVLDSKEPLALFLDPSTMWGPFPK